MRILTAVRERIVRPAARTDARDRYFEAAKLAGRIQVKLSRPMLSGDRPAWLGRLAQHLQTMSEVHREAFGPQPIPEEGGRDLADSHALSALLVQLIADAEYAATWRTPRRVTITELEQHAGSVLDRMAATRSPAQRGQLLDELYEAVVDVVGGQAAEQVHCLPAPGHWRPTTFWQHLMTLPRGGTSSGLSAPGLAATTALILAGILTDGWLRTSLWMGGFALFGGSLPRLRPPGQRWTLVVIGGVYGCLLGSLAATGAVRVALLAGVVLGLAIVARAWWPRHHL
ncbi:hypothetical protein AB0B10_25980 [Micromonospora arborensis]|uniref:hypothetical protein n=1 Tax=Micromonospora arborensis TaxID=2116518 RepID=UPI0033EDA1B4